MVTRLLRRVGGADPVLAPLRSSVRAGVVVLGLAVVGLSALGSCADPVHQVVVVIDTALCEPGDGDTPDFDRVEVTVDGADDPFCAVFDDPGESGCVQIASDDFPLVLPLLSDSGSGSPTVRVQLSDDGALVGCATGAPTFEQDETLLVRIDVERPCGAPSCVEAMTALPAETDLASLTGRTCEPPSPSPEGEILRIGAGAQHACLVDSNGDLFCWGNNDLGQLGIGSRGMARSLPTPVALTTGFVEDVDGGQSHTCAVVADGASRSVRCWGQGADGQIGNMMTGLSNNPVAASGTNGARGLALGPFHSCAYFAGGEVSCWGSNDQGEVNGTPMMPSSAVTVPTMVAGLGGPVEELAAGGSNVDPARHTCARASDGVYCWGSDDSGQLGRTGDGPEVAMVEGLTTATQITAGSRDTCAVDDMGQIWCWGRNNAPGTLGIASDTRTDITTPTRITADTSVLSPPAAAAGPALSTLSSGDNFRCFIDTAGRVSCFGDNSRERLGSAGAGTSDPQPIDMPAGMADLRFEQVVAGTNFACALPEDGGLPWCWGDNTVGQLGRGTSGGTGEPAPIPSCD